MHHHHQKSPVIPAIGFFCSGGHCVIVSMKQYGGSVAKVVNPLGTVVTVNLNHDVEYKKPQQQQQEEVVIHENCDEALFRPVIASKSLHYTDNRKKSSLIDDGNICTKNLKSTTQFTYKITEPSVKNKKVKNEKNHKLELINNKRCVNVDVDEAKPIYVTEPLPPLEDFIDAAEPSIKEQQQHSSSEENVVIEEKIVPKKTRKPKAKLGVRIPKDEPSPLLPPSSPPPVIKSWSSIVSSPTVIKPKELINSDLEIDQLIDNNDEMFQSNDEKLNETTTESDDSAKTPQIVDVIKDDDTTNIENKITLTTATKQRKSKKKKK